MVVKAPAVAVEAPTERDSALSDVYERWVSNGFREAPTLGGVLPL